jgi:hypothetical protein
MPIILFEALIIRIRHHILKKIEILSEIKYQNSKINKITISDFKKKFFPAAALV